MGWFGRGSNSGDGGWDKEQKRRTKATERWQSGRSDRVKSHRSRGIRKAADAGAAWEREDRRRFG